MTATTTTTPTAGAPAETAPSRARGPRTFRTLAIQIGVLAIAAAIFVSVGIDYLYVFNTFLLAVLGAVALNLLMGTVGLVSIGNSAFLLTGAFGTIIGQKLGLPFPLDIVFAGLLSALIGVVIGLPAIRLRGLELALATLAGFFLISQLAAEYQLGNGGGTAGFLIPSLYSSFGLDTAQQYWAITLVLVVAVLLLAVTLISRQRAGRAWRLLRENEIVARGVGIPVTRYKLIAFAISSFVIGVQGSLTAHFSGSISFETFTLVMAISYLAMVTIGGFDSISGAMVGAAVVIGLPILVPDAVGLFGGGSADAGSTAAIATVIYGALIVFFTVSSRRGLAGGAQALWRKTAGLRRRPGLTGDEEPPSQP
ncbi:MAG: hypothetical protein ABS81_09645 [Pseudonocardia sp. SCN 72-86]|nr:MAG: hypothetical protein ABS81_09645 [Pseudonocardia sp. SCN 72-86]